MLAASRPSQAHKLWPRFETGLAFGLAKVIDRALAEMLRNGLWSDVPDWRLPNGKIRRDFSPVLPAI